MLIDFINPIPFLEKGPLPIGISPKNFMTFSFSLSLHWCKTLRLYLVPVPNIELESRPPFKKGGLSGQILIKLKL